jgi:hypothetical protein
MGLDDLLRMDGQDSLNRLRIDYLVMGQLAIQNLVVEGLEIIRSLSKYHLRSLNRFALLFYICPWNCMLLTWRYVDNTWRTYPPSLDT